MIQLYEEGGWDAEVCKSLKVSYTEFDTRYKNDTIFQHLVDYGRLAAKAWWLELGRKGASGAIKGFNFQPWFAVMKNRFGWTDKSEISSGDDKPADQLSQEELISKISLHKTRLAKLLKSQNIFTSIDDGSTAN